MYWCTKFTLKSKAIDLSRRTIENFQKMDVLNIFHFADTFTVYIRLHSVSVLRIALSVFYIAFRISSSLIRFRNAHMEKWQHFLEFAEL